MMEKCLERWLRTRTCAVRLVNKELINSGRGPLRFKLYKDCRISDMGIVS